MAHPISRAHIASFSLLAAMVAPALGLTFDTPGPHIIDHYALGGPGYPAIDLRGDAHLVIEGNGKLWPTPTHNAIRVGDRSLLEIAPMTTPGASVRLVSPSTGSALGIRAWSEAKILFQGSMEVTQTAIGDGILFDLHEHVTAQVEGNSSVIESGNGSAIGLRAVDQSCLAFSGAMQALESGNGDAIGVNLNGHTLASLTGTIEITENGNGDAIGASLSGNAATCSIGTIQLTEYGNGDAVAVKLSGNTMTSISGRLAVSEYHNGNAIGYSATDSTVLHSAATLTIEEEGNGDAILARASGHSRSFIEGRSIATTFSNIFGIVASQQSEVIFTGSSESIQRGSGETILADLSDDAYVRFNGQMQVEGMGNRRFSTIYLDDYSAFQFEGGLIAIPPPQRRAFVESKDEVMLKGNSHFEWLGGEFIVTNSADGTLPRFSLEEASRLVLHGNAVNRPLGPVEDLEGILEGTLSDGSSFAFQFRRAPTAAIIIVPEAPSAVLLLFGAFLAIRRFPRVALM